MALLARSSHQMDTFSKNTSSQLVTTLLVGCPYLINSTNQKQNVLLLRLKQRRRRTSVFTSSETAAGSSCRRVHFHLPYKWEIFNIDAWTELPNMEDIERDYCDPSKTCSNDPPVDFVTMMLESLPVRRLSTVSSVTKPPHYSLTTCWLWYYRGDHGNWVEYGQLDDKQRLTSVTSQSLEKKYLSDKTAKVNVMKGQRDYVICFKDMYQRNPKHKTKRRVCRRPRFVSRAEVDRLLAEHRKRSG